MRRARVDYVADITKLDSALPAGLTFDAICAFQVLEHLPFAEFETCLANIARRANPHVFVSLPYRGLRIRFGRSGGATITSRSATSSCCRGGTSRSPSITGSSAIRTPRARSRSVIARHLDVVSRGFIRENPYHYMWQLRPRAQLPVGS